MQPANKRVCECEEQRDTNADHGDSIEQRDDDEHLRLQHRCQLRLTCGAFKEAAAEQPHADTNAEGAETD